MRFRILSVLIVVGLGLFAIVQSRTTAAHDSHFNGKRTPVIVELFTSEGCSSCPPADALLRKLESDQPVPNAEIIVLGEHVDYWNSLGWTDRFSSKELTERQERYANAFKLDSSYTPQMVVSGELEMNGADASTAKKAIAQAAKSQPAVVTVQFKKNDAGLPSAVYGVDEADGLRDADLVLAITESGLQTQVKAGENDGHTLMHTGVVRYWKAFRVQKMSMGGTVPLNVDPSWKRENLRVVAFLQDKKTLHILGATSEKFPQ